MMTKVYLAIPYTGMRKSSYKQANEFMVWVMNNDFNPFSPITHSHPATKYGVQQDWTFWEKIDKDWIEVCDEVWILVPEEGEERVLNSTGVQAEIEFAKELEKPIKYFIKKGNSYEQRKEVRPRKTKNRPYTS